MHLRKISLINFKNIEHSDLEFSEGINCFVVENAAGKTNVMDAIHFLSLCKSFLSLADSQAVSHGKDFFMLEGHYETGRGKIENITCSFKKGSGKTLKRNGKEYDRLSEHIGTIPLVIVSPAVSSIICDAAEERRRYINSFLSQFDKDYLSALVKYNQVLAERNRYLKQPRITVEDGLLDILDMQLAGPAAIIHSKRREITGRLAPLVTEYYSRISSQREEIEMEYHSELNERDMAGVLIDSRAKDMACQFTTSGIHRDDIKMRISGYPLRKFGSQGQQKSFIIALKMAQFTILKEEKGENPILLLDDLFDKLDMDRVGQLLQMVSPGNFGQIFITDCNKVRLENILRQNNASYSLFDVSDGNIRPQ